MAQNNSEAGFLEIQNFSPKDYGGAHAQNWAIAQDRRGIMYFGNNLGVLEYDGVSWRLTPVSNKTIVRSLNIDQKNDIYVGAVGEFGYLAPDSSGQLYYISLLDMVPEEYRDFDEVWQITHTSEGIYFRTDKYLFRKAQQAPEQQQSDGHTTAKGILRVWKADESFHKCFTVRDTLYIRQRTVGLMRMTSDSLQLLPGGERFADDGVHIMLPFERHNSQTLKSLKSQEILVGSYKSGLFIFNGSTFQPYQSELSVHKYLIENKPVHGARLADNTFALATRHGGVIIINQQGQIVRIVNKASGLKEEYVKFVYPDQQGGLWLSLNTGLARVEYPAPFTFYNESTGITGYINSIVRFGGEIYSGGNNGIFRLLPAADHRTPVFQQVPGVAFTTWSLIVIEDALLAATSNGIYCIEKNRVVKLSDIKSRFLYQSRYNQDMVFAGLDEGVAVLKRQNGQWRFAARVDGVSEEVRTITEESPGILWLGIMQFGIIRVKIQGFPGNFKNRDSVPANFKTLSAEIQRFGPQQGLPVGTGRVFFVKGRVVLATNEGLKKFIPANGNFQPDTSFGTILADTTRVISHVLEDSAGKLWIKTTKDGRRETGLVLLDAAGHYTWNSTAFRRIAEWGSVYAMYADPHYEDVVWFGGPEGLARYDHNINKNYSSQFPTLIRKVVALKQDSLVYGGASAATDYSSQEERFGKAKPILPYMYNNLRFQFAATSYDDPKQNSYQVFLEGLDDEWSVWIKETNKDYTNIPEGDYTFHVRAKNIYGHLGKEAHFSFTILAPWYRTWWAYIIYMMLFAGMMLAFVKHREKVLKKNTVKLELAVAERTNDLELEKRKTEAQAEELKDLNNLKSRFFANISHEFRTPLTLILGQIESVLPDVKKEHNISRLQMAYSNALKLQRLINQLLDLSKFDAHEMKLQAAEQNIVLLLKQYSKSFENLAEKRGITLSFENTSDVIYAFIDRDMLEKIMYNLLSNALKFTPKGGSVLVRLEKYILAGLEEVVITIRDSGIGIPAERLPHVFDRFFQVDSTTTREFEGTGIGLALTKELVQIHGGGISVESEDGFGATFTVRLPLGKSHLKEDQILSEYQESPGQLRDTYSNPRSDYMENEISDSNSGSNNEHLDSGDKVSVLIVEDNSDMRTYIVDSLMGNYQVLEAVNGEEGFSLAQEHIPDLIITDVMMPKADGYELTRMLRQDMATSHIPIIMLTAKAEETDKFEGLETGADVYLTKPFSTKELQIRVRKLIERYQSLRGQAGINAIFRPSEIEISSIDQQFLEQIRGIVESNIGNDIFNVDELAGQMSIGKRQLQRKLKALTDLTPQQCIRSMRMQRARQLLEEGAGNVSEICYMVGYNDVSAFSKAFSEEFSKPPSGFIPRKQ